VHVVVRKVGKLNTPSGQIEGEKSMWAEVGELMTVENTIEVYPGLYVTGMACNAVMGAPRMGPIFGGMLLSGKKVADLILEKEKSAKIWNKKAKK
jgi:ribulose 1,5-bisphosphate synthetase/thiazole synthase